MSEPKAKDRIGNDLHVKDMLLFAQPDTTIQGFVTAITEANLIAVARGKPHNTPGYVTIMAKFDIPIDPATGRMVNGMKVYDPTPELTEELFK